MKTKQIFHGLLVAGALLVGASGCSKGGKDEDRKPDVEKPTIKNLVIGQNNIKTVHLGEKLSVEADIIAPGKINRVLITLNTLEATVPVTISTTLDKDLKDKTEAHFKWETLMEDVPTGKYRFVMTIEAKAGETGQIISEFTVLPK